MAHVAKLEYKNLNWAARENLKKKKLMTLYTRTWSFDRDFTFVTERELSRRGENKLQRKQEDAAWGNLLMVRRALS